MNKLIIFLVLLSMSCTQKKEVQIEEKKDKKSILLKASFISNNSFRVDEEFIIYSDTTFSIHRKRVWF